MSSTSLRSTISPRGQLARWSTTSSSASCGSIYISLPQWLPAVAHPLVELPGLSSRGCRWTSGGVIRDTSLRSSRSRETPAAGRWRQVYWEILQTDRRSVVWGKRVYGQVDFGGGRV